MFKIVDAIDKIDGRPRNTSILLQCQDRTLFDDVFAIGPGVCPVWQTGQWHCVGDQDGPVRMGVMGDRQGLWGQMYQISDETEIRFTIWEHF